MANPLAPEIKTRLQTLEPRAFELFAGDLLAFMGLQQVSVTRYRGDGGIDATAQLSDKSDLIQVSLGVQVKRYRQNVQRVEIDRFIGALSGQFQHGLFITNAQYAPQALLKARAGVPPITTIDGKQLADLMVEYRLGVVRQAQRGVMLDHDYFALLEAQATQSGAKAKQQGGIAEQKEEYQVSAPADLISLYALSHMLRMDTTTLRRWIERGVLVPAQTVAGAGNGFFFERNQVPAIRKLLLSKAEPNTNEEWRAEFLQFAASRNLTKSYKPVLLLALLRLVNAESEVWLDELVPVFRTFYSERKQAGLLVEFGPPDISDVSVVSDAQLRRLIVQHPLERFLIKGFLSFDSTSGLIRFNPALWEALRWRDRLELEALLHEQLRYYYQRSSA
jgi:hypothetical protein